MTPEQALEELGRRKHDQEVLSLNDEACRLMSAGDYENARAKLGKAIQLNPGYPIAHVNLAASYMEQGRWSEAIPCLERAIAIDPTVEGGAGALAQCRAKAISSKPTAPSSQRTKAAPASRKWWQFWK
jgi:tetratricopeptide (TPR) repeat protein